MVRLILRIVNNVLGLLRQILQIVTKLIKLGR